MKQRRVLIAAGGSSHGKTVLTLLLLAWARREGIRTRAFKAGPDFIDAQYLAAVSGQAAPSLDPWFLEGPALKAHFNTWAAGQSLAVVEGVMGLYDGKRNEPFGAFSSATVAATLDLPVLLVLDARKAGPTLATQVLGLQEAGPRLRFAGVVLNRAASAKSVENLAGAIRSLCGLPVLGWLPSLESLHWPERHLGLTAASEMKAWQRSLGKALKEAEKTVDFAALYASLKKVDAPAPKAITRTRSERFDLAVARDAAFHFYYPENLASLESAGARLRFFSPLKSKRLPRGCNGLLIGGGFPELFGKQLAANRVLRADVKRAVAAGLPTWAECGGLMWLAESLRDLKGKRYAMVGALGASTSMSPRLQHFGYTQAAVGEGHAFLPAGLRLRGHEFHHSQFEALSSPVGTWTLEQSGRPGRLEGWRLPQGLATYFHSYFSSEPAQVEAFAACCRGFRAS